MNVRYRVMLTQYERHELGVLLSGGKQAARKLKRAQILLAADAGVGDEEIAASVGVGGSTVYRTKRWCEVEAVEAPPHRNPPAHAPADEPAARTYLPPGERQPHLANAIIHRKYRAIQPDAVHFSERP
jgi:hypothetical protein